jgi:hypothetical protein
MENEKLKEQFVNYLEARSAAYRAMTVLGNEFFPDKTMSEVADGLDEIESWICGATEGEMSRQDLTDAVDRYFPDILKGLSNTKR